MSLGHSFVFPDTNIFLHFRPLEEVDIPSIIDCESATVVILPAVIDELDRIKWEHPSSGIRDRAYESLKRIKLWLENNQRELRRAMRVELGIRPHDEIFSKLGLNPRSGDDVILAAIMSEAKADAPIDRHLLTNDIGSQLRAKTLGIRVFELPQSLRLPPAQDKQKSELLRLTRELERFRLRSPNLSLLFKNESSEASVRIHMQERFDKDAARRRAENLLAEMRKQLPEFRPAVDPDSPKISQISNMALALATYSQIPEEEFERYRAELDAFEPSYLEYADRRNSVENRIRRSIRLHLLLVNTGTAIAEDIILAISIPDKLYWQTSFGEAELPEPLKQPNPPRTQMQIMASKLDWSSQLTSLATPIAHPVSAADRAFQGPYIEGHKCTWQFDSLHHHSQWTVGSMVATFISAESISNFELGYSIRERHTPTMLTGKLLMRVEES